MTRVGRRPSGELPGGYALGRPIGRGNFATVYAGNAPDGEPVAIKVLSTARPQALRRFQREIKVLRALPPSPNVVRYIDHGVTSEELHYLVMELVDGEPLGKRLKRDGVVDELRACRLMVQLCAALAGLHKLGVTHGDIKPNNILLERGSEGVKLLDFGLVRDAQGLLRLFEEEQILEGDDFAENLDMGVLIGTPAYLSPEQIDDARLRDWSRRRTDTPSDVYGLGVIFYEMLSGRLPYPFDFSRNAGSWEELKTYLAARLAMDDGELVPLSGVSPELWSVLKKALRQDPKLRQGDARVLQGDIERYLSSGLGIPEELDEDDTLFMGQVNLAELAASHGLPAPSPPSSPVASEPTGPAVTRPPPAGIRRVPLAERKSSSMTRTRPAAGPRETVAGTPSAHRKASRGEARALPRSRRPTRTPTPPEAPEPDPPASGWRTAAIAAAIALATVLLLGGLLLFGP